MEHGSHLGGSQQAGLPQLLLATFDAVIGQGVLDARGCKGKVVACA
jgi:hypothetical protein